MPLLGERAPAWSKPGRPAPMADLQHGLVPGQPGSGTSGTGGLVHGAASGALIRERAAQIVTAVLENPSMPDHLRSATFSWALQKWAELAAAADRYLAWCETLGDAAFLPLMPGTAPPIEAWSRAVTKAMTAAGKLGLDPKSYAQIARDLGLAEKATDDAIARLAEGGKALVRSRGLDPDAG